MNVNSFIRLIILVSTAGVFGCIRRIDDSQSKEDATVLIIEKVLTPVIEAFKHDTGRYPKNKDGLSELVTRPTSDTARWKGPYLPELPRDPWGREFMYALPGKHNKERFDIWSHGRNTNDINDDIGNWKKMNNNSGNQ